MVTVSEIEKAITAKHGDYEDEFYEALSNCAWNGKTINLPKVGKVELVEEGDDRSVDSYGYADSYARWIIFKVGDQTFRKNGYYVSHGGADWDGGLFEVSQEIEYIERKVWREV